MTEATFFKDFGEVSEVAMRLSRWSESVMRIWFWMQVMRRPSLLE